MDMVQEKLKPFKEMGIDEILSKLPSDGEIMEQHSGWIAMGFVQREIARIRYAMEEFPIHSKPWTYLHVAQQALYYSLDPSLYGRPHVTALSYATQPNQSNDNVHNREDR